MARRSKPWGSTHRAHWWSWRRASSTCHAAGILDAVPAAAARAISRGARAPAASARRLSHSQRSTSSAVLDAAPRSEPSSRCSMRARGAAATGARAAPAAELGAAARARRPAPPAASGSPRKEHPVGADRTGRALSGSLPSRPRAAPPDVARAGRVHRLAPGPARFGRSRCSVSTRGDSARQEGGAEGRGGGRRRRRGAAGGALAAMATDRADRPARRRGGRRASRSIRPRANGAGCARAAPRATTTILIVADDERRARTAGGRARGRGPEPPAYEDEEDADGPRRRARAPRARSAPQRARRDADRSASAAPARRVPRPRRSDLGALGGGTRSRRAARRELLGVSPGGPHDVLPQRRDRSARRDADVPGRLRGVAARARHAPGRRAVPRPTRMVRPPRVAARRPGALRETLGAEHVHVQPGAESCSPP